MHPEDIADGENVPRGTRELRAYLEYARSGTLTQVEGQQGEPDSDFEVAVMDALAHHGYECTPQLGVAGFRIDLAVRHPKHPNAYLAAVECDGATYHSGRSARDRDRIRQEILESLGWRGRIFRIWSTDWYRNPTTELARLTSWLEHVAEIPLEEAYLVADSEELVASEGTQSSIVAMGISVETEDEPLEVQVGDEVTYRLQDGTETAVTIGLVTTHHRGIVAYTSPLAEALLGLTEGETGTLRQPDRPGIAILLVRIRRAQQAESSNVVNS